MTWINSQPISAEDSDTPQLGDGLILLCERGARENDHGDTRRLDVSRSCPLGVRWLSGSRRRTTQTEVTRQIGLSRGSWRSDMRGSPGGRSTIARSLLR